MGNFFRCRKLRGELEEYEIKGAEKEAAMHVRLPSDSFEQPRAQSDKEPRKEEEKREDMEVIDVDLIPDKTLSLKRSRKLSSVHRVQYTCMVGSGMLCIANPVRVCVFISGCDGSDRARAEMEEGGTNFLTFRNWVNLLSPCGTQTSRRKVI